MTDTNTTFSPLDIHFGKLMQRLDKGDRDEALFILSALVSSLTREGHTCLYFSDLDDDLFLREKLGEELAAKIDKKQMQSAAEKATVIGRPGDFQPLILDNKNRLYLNRYWNYQSQLAAYITSQTTGIQTPQSSDLIKQRLRSYFPTVNADDWQKIAAVTALLKKFCVITGGPGTGKTYTVGKILALMVESNAELRIVLAAPTGKAAVRLQESIKQVKEILDCSDDIKNAIPIEARTIHRLLGYIPNSPFFRYDRDNPVEADVVVVDEASMVDLALMAKLVDALLPSTHLILLGDQNQLASVEAGAILADICDGPGSINSTSAELKTQIETLIAEEIDLELSENTIPALQDCIVQLEKSYRFAKRSGLEALSETIIRGDGKQAFELLSNETYPEIIWHDLESETIDVRNLLTRFNQPTPDETPEELLNRFGEFRILCALRNGPQGIITLNRIAEKFFKNKMQTQETWYAGQPLLITENDYRLNLFNGDLGIVLPDPADKNLLTTYFPSPDKGLRKIASFRLPEHETAYAMTVHKSQGSEFDEIILILPEQDSPILTRELIYTAITRAAKRVEIWGNQDVFLAAVARNIKRSSGLRDLLWQA